MSKGPAPKTVLERFSAKVDQRDPDECWPWKGALHHGYGRLMVGSRSDNSRHLEQAHRISFVLNVGPIPEGKEIDHLCRNKSCVNPAHLEAVTHAANIRRAHGTHDEMCKHGHNEWRRSATEKRSVCLACARLKARKYRANNRVTVT